MTTINTNTAALTARLYLERNDKVREEAFARLASGQKVNSSADDAAGLAISARMTAQIQGLKMAAKNANDSNSLAQVADSAMDEVTNMLQRMRELAVQSANGTVNQSDRGSLDGEIQALKAEIDRVATTTQFNSQNLLDGSYKNTYQIGDKVGQSLKLDIGSIKTSALGMGSSSGHNSGQSIVGTRLGTYPIVSGSSRALIARDIQAGDIKINGQDVGAIAAGADMEDVLKAINDNVDNVKATAFNVVVAKQKGNGVLSDVVAGDGGGDLRIHASSSSADVHTGIAGTYAISASSSVEEMVNNINNETGGVVLASLNDEGKLMLSNDTGATIRVFDYSAGRSPGNTPMSNGGSGFIANDNDEFQMMHVFHGFIKLTSLDGSPIRIERGNLGLSSPGTDDDLAALGFQETVVAKSENLSTSASIASITQENASWGVSEAARYFALAPLSGGNSIAAFEDTTHAGGNIKYQRFDIDGNVLGGAEPPIYVNTDTGTHVPSVTQLSNGNTVVVWQVQPSNRSQAYYKVFDTNDIEIASGYSSQNSTEDNINVKVVDLGDDKFAIDYQVHVNYPAGYAAGSKIRVFDYSGNALSNEFQYDTTGDNTRGDLISLGDGKVQTLQLHTTTENLKLHIVDTTSQSVSKTVQIHNFTSRDGNIELVQGTGANYVTFNDNGAYYVAKIGSDGSIIKSPTALSVSDLTLGTANNHFQVVEVSQMF